MAFRSILRLGFAIAATMATVCITAPSTYAHADQTTCVTAGSGWGQVIAYVDVSKAFDVCPLSLHQNARHVERTREHPVFMPMAIKERASRAAVRPTTVAGWRSGRARHLAA